jgi:hypothetical protein
VVEGSPSEQSAHPFGRGEVHMPAEGNMGYHPPAPRADQGCEGEGRTNEVVNSCTGPGGGTCCTRDAGQVPVIARRSPGGPGRHVDDVPTVLEVWAESLIAQGDRAGRVPRALHGKTEVACYDPHPFVPGLVHRLAYNHGGKPPCVSGTVVSGTCETTHYPVSSSSCVCCVICVPPRGQTATVRNSGHFYAENVGTSLLLASVTLLAEVPSASLL